MVPPPIYVPLTDRSYVAFAQALHSVSGVALSGPATSGKKAAVSHLGASLGRKMFWLRASEDSCPGQMDLIVQALVGMVGAGVWCCLDSWSWSNGSAAAACAVHLKAVLDVGVGNDKVESGPREWWERKFKIAIFLFQKKLN